MSVRPDADTTAGVECLIHETNPNATDGQDTIDDTAYPFKMLAGSSNPLSILVNRARTTGVREARSVPVADAGPVVDASRFGPSGAWAVPPEHWIEEAEDRIDAVKLSELLRAGLGSLPARQREVVLLRDVEELSSAEVCQVLAISEANQRVLLHRGRSKLRQVLETELGGGVR